MTGYTTKGTFHDFTGAQLFATSDGNWDYFVDYPWTDTPDRAAVWAVAKEGTGSESSTFGGLDHVRKLIRLGYWDHVQLTPYGRQLLGIA